MEPPATGRPGRIDETGEIVNGGLENSARIALLVPSLTQGGGAPGVARFLYRTLEASHRYVPFLVSLAMSSRDETSVRLRAPRSWLRGVEVSEGTWKGRDYVHVGAPLAELEFMRYSPRRRLTSQLEKADLVQVVAGTPCWALPAARYSGPVLLQVATLTGRERARRQRVESGPKALWRRIMTGITSRLDRTGLEQADRIFVENRWMERAVAEIVGSDRVVFAPPGVDVDRFRPAGADQTSEHDSYILSVARFGDPRKNAELLFRAYGMLARKTPEPPELRLAGTSGPRARAWRVAREMGVDHRIRYVGEVSDHELESLYRHADLFVLSSDQEGFGLVLTEAMASGTPVVSTACGGPEDIVSHGENGLLTPRGDAGALAEAMERLLAEPDRRREMGVQARKTAVERYSEAVASQRFLDVYDELRCV